MRVAIAGMGDVGGRLAGRLAARGDAVLGLRRRPSQAAPGVEQRAVDLATLCAGDLQDWAAEAVVFVASPDRREPDAYRRIFHAAPAALCAALGASVRRFILVSSTAVYGDGGDWVDEQTPPSPTRWNGALLLEAEQRAAIIPGLVVVRPSGLYGPGRESLLRRARASEAGEARWTNRLHVDDLADALLHVLDLPNPLTLYCATDDTPVMEHQVLAGLRELLGVAAVPTPPLAEAPRGRRVSNQRLRASGWAPRFPDYRSGYLAVLRDAPMHQV